MERDHISQPICVVIYSTFGSDDDLRTTYPAMAPFFAREESSFVNG